jgi:molybdenum cofactor cytidylyltransferase
MGAANKLLLKYRGHTIIEEVLEQLSNSEVDDILIVTGSDREVIEAKLESCVSDRVSLAHNSDYRTGRAESVKCAIRRMDNAADAALFMVADKPGVSTALIDSAIGRFRDERPAVLFVKTPNGRGHPIIFSRTVFDDLLSLEGDQVGNELIEKYKSDLVALDDATEQLNINTDDDYRALLAAQAAKGTLESSDDVGPG